MKKFNLMFRSMTAAITVIAATLAGCSGEPFDFPFEDPILPSDATTAVHNAWRVSTISGDLPYYNMSAKYTYDAEGRLIMADMSERNSYQEWTTRYEEVFEWRGGRPVKHSTLLTNTDKFSPHNDSSQTYETLYRYNSEGLLLHWDNENWYGERNYKYDARGRLIQTYSYKWEGTTYADRLEWDERGNVAKHILAGPKLDTDIGWGWGDRLPGTYKETVFEYEYDNHPKPNFGLSGAFFWDGRFSPWPFENRSNTIDELARSLSGNNITLCKRAGHEYRYTYNEHGLPATVTIVWAGDTRATAYLEPGPLTQTITYIAADSGGDETTL